MSRQCICYLVFILIVLRFHSKVELHTKFSNKFFEMIVVSIVVALVLNNNKNVVLHYISNKH